MQDTLPRVIEATVDIDGKVTLLSPLHVAGARRAFVTVLDEAPADHLAHVSDPSLARDWNRPEEEAAWSHLQPAPSS
jgi:hypothetical protein